MPLSEPKTLRAQTVRQALTRHQHCATTPTADELIILTQYVLGHLNMEQTNAQLRQHGSIVLTA